MVAVTSVGAQVAELDDFAELFSEFPGRFIVATGDLDAFATRAAAAGVPMVSLGTCGGERLVIGSTVDLSVDDIAATRRGALEAALSALS
jgi:hypothetical protein